MSVQAGEPYNAVQAFRDLRGSGLTPNVVTWCGQITALSRFNRRGSAFAHLAHDLWTELQSLGMATGHPAVYAAGVPLLLGASHISKATLIICTALGVLCKQRSCRELTFQWHHLFLMTPSYASALMLWAGINACVGMGYVEEAEEVLRTMQASGMRPDVRAYNMLLKGYANARDLDSLQRIRDEMAAAQIQPSIVTCNTLIDAYVNNDHVEKVGNP